MINSVIGTKLTTDKTTRLGGWGRGRGQGRITVQPGGGWNGIEAVMGEIKQVQIRTEPVEAVVQTSGVAAD